MQHRVPKVIELGTRTGCGLFVYSLLALGSVLMEYLPHVVRICCFFRPYRKSRVTPVHAYTFKYNSPYANGYPVRLVI
jgi:hypothetical protein